MPKFGQVLKSGLQRPMKRKDKIIDAARLAFNDKGYGAVNLLELAQIMSISRGNLTYHFKNKDELLQAIVDEMWHKIERESKIVRELPSFENLHREVKMYLSIQKEYSFIYLDSQITTHPAVQDKIRTMIKQSIESHMHSIAFAIQLGNIKPEPFAGAYRSLAFSTWMVGYYWLSQKTLRGDSEPLDPEKIAWGMILPHMTEKGVASFKKYYGDSYFNHIGEPLNIDLQNILTQKASW